MPHHDPKLTGQAPVLAEEAAAPDYAPTNESDRAKVEATLRAGHGSSNTPHLTSRTTGSAASLIILKLATKSVDFVTLLILARLLSPADFGITAIAMTLILIVEAIFELPVSQVMVSLDEITPAHFDTAFTLSLIRGFALAAVLWALSGPFANIYHDPRVENLIRFASFAPALRGLVSPRMAIYIRRIDFRREILTDACSKTLSFFVAVLSAFLLRDYYALIISMLANPILFMFISYGVAPYRPRLSLSKWRQFAHFLSWTTAAQTLGALNWQCDRLLLGRYVTPSALGTFSLANDLAFIPEQALVRPILRPILAAFSHIRKDRARLQSAYSKTANTVLGVGAPVLIGLSLLADPAVHLALGGKWIPAIPMLELLSLTLIPPLFTSPFMSLAMSIGRSDIALKQTAGESATKLPFMAVGAMFYGVYGAIAARAGSQIITALYIIYLNKRLIGLPVSHQIFGTWKTAVASVVLAISLIIMRPILDGCAGVVLGLLLAVVSFAGLAVYIFTLATLWHITGRPAGFEQAAYDRLMPLLRWPHKGSRATT